MTADEKRLVREMHFEKRVKPARIAEIVGRNISSICRLLAQKKRPRSIGRPTVFTEAQVDKTVAVLEKMVDDAEANYEVTLPMVMRRCRHKVCERVVRDALHKR